MSVMKNDRTSTADDDKMNTCVQQSQKITLLNHSIVELSQMLALPNFRVKQIYKWLTRYKDFDEMTDISKDLRTSLENKYIALPMRIVLTRKSRDGTEKYLFECCDGASVEAVFMQYSYGNTLCISTQVGCRMGCVFCATGQSAFCRNLTAAEILAQVLCVNALHGGDVNDRKVTNIVLMGMGEPLDNYENVLKFLELVTSVDGLNISPRNISLSTCGLVDKIKEFADVSHGVNLTISLHASDDATRQITMPIAKRYSIAEIIDACKYYFEKTGRRIYIEYVLLKNINMTDLDVKRLSQLLKGFPVHMNLIMLNGKVSDKTTACNRMEAEAFCKKLGSAGIDATIRRSLGGDIEGACGQLKARNN